MEYSFFRRALQVLTLALVVMGIARIGNATTAALLTDEQLITSSRVIMLGEVQSLKAAWNENHEKIYTYVKVQVNEVLKGQLFNQQIVFKQLGGTVGDESTIIFGTPEFEQGQRVLLFLDTAPDGTLRIAHLFQGKYDVVEDANTGRVVVERKIDRGSINLVGLAESPEITNHARLFKFNRKINKLLKAKSVDVQAYNERYADTPIVEIPLEYVDDATTGNLSPKYTFLGSGFRWTEPDTGLAVTYRVNPSGAPVAGGGVNEVSQALGAWTNVQTTALTLQYAGSTTAAGFRADGVTAISFNDPFNEITDPVGCSGTLAIGGVTRGGSPITTVGGRSFYRIYEGDVVFNNNFQCFLGNSVNLAEVACHEIGHTLGFGHSTDFGAIMYATAHGNGRGATLGSDDIAAVSFLYPGSKGGTPPAPPLAPTNLTATAISTSSINLAWTDASTNEQGFRVERKTGAFGSYAQVASLGAGQTSYADNSLQSGTTYYYRVYAYNGAGQSPYSAEAFATTLVTTPPPTSNNAAFVSQSVPTTMTAGQAYSVSVTMGNTGTTTWNANSTYKLGSQNPQDNATWGLNRVTLSSSVLPNANATFTFSVTAPATAGSYNFQWRMLQEGAGYFGASSTNIVVSVTPASSGTSLSITTISLANARRNVFYSQSISVTGGSSPYTWSISSGSLPSGISLNSSTGVISGVSTTAGSYIFTVRVQDQVGNVVSKTYKLSVYL